MTIATRNIYADLGLRRVVNAYGVVTIMGGALMPEPVIAAMAEAARSSVVLRELQERAGERIAELAGVEAAIVSSGAAGGILLAAAAVLAGPDREKILALPRTDGWRNEFVVPQAVPNYMYQAIEMAGGRLVAAGTDRRLELEDVAHAIGDRTAAVFIVAAYFDARQHDGTATATLSAIAEIARARGVPVIVDAASELPPTDNLRRFLREGADLVVFSGGKGIRGPQATGLVLGRPDLVRAAHANNNPNSAVARSCKVGKEELVGLVAAFELFVARDEDAELRNYDARMRRMAEELADVPGVRTSVRTGPDGRPTVLARCYVDFDEAERGLTRAEVVRRLLEGEPRVALGPTPTGIVVNPYVLNPDDDRVVISRIQEVFTAGR